MVCASHRYPLNVVPVTAMAVLFGILVGGILGLTGAGGTIVAVPLLVFGLQLLVKEAAPVALLAVSVSAAIGALMALKQGKVRYRAAAFIAFTGALASPVGVHVAQMLPDVVLNFLFAAVLGYVAFRMFRQSGHYPVHSAEISAGGPPLTPCQIDDSSGRFVWDARCARSLALSGLGAGFLSGLLGVGGGFMIVPALQKATLLSMQSIVSTSLAVIALVSAAGTAPAILNGSMNWQIALPFTAGTVAAMLATGRFARRFSAQRLQKGFATLAVAAAIGMMGKVLAALIGLTAE